MDLVYDALGGLAATIGAIKTAAESVWNGIKAAGQFIANAVITTMHSLMKSTIELGIKSIVALFSSLIPDISYSESNGLIEVKKDGEKKFDFKLGSSIEGFWIDLNGNKINILNPLLNTDFEFDHTETLGIDPMIGSLSFIAWSAITLIISTLVSQGLGTQGLAVPSNILLQTIVQVLLLTFAGIVVDLVLLLTKSGTEKELYRDRIGAIHIGLGVGMFYTLIDRAKVPNKSKTLEATINQNAWGFFGDLITFVDSIGGLSAKASLIGSVIYWGGQALSWAIPLLQFLFGVFGGNSQEFLTDLGNFAITIGYGVMAGFIPILMEKNPLSSKKAPKAAIKIYAPIIWTVAFIHIITGLIFTLI